MSTLARGLAAGAVGTTVLNTVTYLDMALRGRPASSTPDQVVDALADRLGTPVPGRRGERDNRRTALGALSGTATGLAVGVVTSVARAKGFRLPGALAGVATGGIAMAASDVPVAALGISDPRTWTTQDWASDVVPHLAYGVATHATLQALSPTAEGLAAAPATAGLVCRSFALGLASGSRTSLGPAAPVLTDRSPDGPGALARLVALAGVGTEVVMDKQPGTPSRLQPGALVGRVVAGASGATMLSRREASRPAAPAVAAALGALAGSYGGFAWRGWAGRRVPDWQAALLEDGVAVVLAGVATLTGRRQQPVSPVAARR